MNNYLFTDDKISSDDVIPSLVIIITVKLTGKNTYIHNSARNPSSSLLR